MSGPMHGVTVLDLGTMIAGPGAATILSDQGADVIKIETPGIGDVMRYLSSMKDGISGLYHNVNRGKRSIAINLKSAAGVDLLKDMARSADVVVENFRPGVAERLGVGYEALREVNKELIYLSVCGFGDKGPNSGKAAYDNVIQAFAGVSQSQADRQTGEPIQYFQLFCDKTTALTGSQAISAALFARERGAGGQHIKLSMVDSVVSFLWADVAGVATFLEAGAEEGMTIAKGVRLMQFKDGYGAAAPVNDAQFFGYCAAFGIDASDPKFATISDRNANSEAMMDLMRDVICRAAETTAADAMAAMEANDVPCSIAQDLADLPEHPQMIANNSFARIDNPTAGAMVEPNNPPNFLATPSPALRPASALGQHSDEIMAAAGRSETEIAALRESGVVG